MKKIIAICLIFLSMLVFVDCAKPDKCETNDTGTVKVTNNAGFTIIVDVTWGSSTYNDERTLTNGSYTIYNDVPVGTISVWASVDDVNWYYDYSYVNQCEQSTYSWSKKKSATEKSTSGIILYNEYGNGLDAKTTINKNHK